MTVERRAYVDGNTAVIYLPSKGLAYGQTYTVTVPAGAIVPNGGGSFSTSGNAWRFSTASAAPASLANVTVALDGTGAFCSLQGALDAVPNGGNATTALTLKSGKYHEVVYFKNKNNVTIHGESRTETVILGTNNNTLNPSTKTRALVGGDGSQGIVFENLTIQNLTPQGGSQAEALRLESCTHCTIRDATIQSLQDTLLWSGTLYAKNCLIEGNVDFIWGTGTAYFDQCEIKTVGRSGYVVQARNGTSGYGYVFVDSKLTADAGITGSVLARIDVSAYPGSHVAYVNCAMGSHISRAGWLVTGGSPSSSLRFWEYESTDLDGNPLDVSGRLAGSTQISASQAATMRDPSAVLGGWQPN
jgi:pectin methylesterase-like acyl-CoA thioesterase